MYLPTRNCVDIYERLLFFGLGVGRAAFCSIGVGANKGGMLVSVEVTDVELMSSLFFIFLSSCSASSYDKSPHSEVSLIPKSWLNRNIW